jgi:hypothetical protein
MPHALSPERAEILALEALAWLAADEGGITRFLAASGVDAADLRDAAGSTGLAVAILNFLLAHEDLLLAFCESSGTSAIELHRASHLLEPEA